MKLYCKPISGTLIVIATHDDNQDVPASAYGDTAVIVQLSRWVDDTGAPLPASVENLRAYATGRRRAAIAVGTVVGSIPTWTDSESQSALTSLMLAASLNPAIATSWKGRDGNFHPLTAASIAALALGVMGYVQSCFTAEATALAGIASGSITTFTAVDAVLAG